MKYWHYTKVFCILSIAIIFLDVNCVAQNTKKVLAISVSPRENGNSETLLLSFLKGAKESGGTIEIIRISKLNIPAWTNPNYSSKSFSSSDENKIYDKIRTADIVVIASPIYFASLPAQMKALIDQAQLIWRNQIFKKINFRDNMADGYFLCVEGSDIRSFFDNARHEIKAFFRTVNISYRGEVFCCNVNNVGDIDKKKKNLQKAYELGKKAIKDFVSNDHSIIPVK